MRGWRWEGTHGNEATWWGRQSCLACSHSPGSPHWGWLDTALTSPHSCWALQAKDGVPLVACPLQGSTEPPKARSHTLPAQEGPLTHTRLKHLPPFHMWFHSKFLDFPSFHMSIAYSIPSSFTPLSPFGGVAYSICMVIQQSTARSQPPVLDSRERRKKVKKVVDLWSKRVKEPQRTLKLYVGFFLLK